jgi:hypothetical protein
VSTPAAAPEAREREIGCSICGSDGSTGHGLFKNIVGEWICCGPHAAPARPAPQGAPESSFAETDHPTDDYIHDAYGPCDSFGPHAQCSECIRLVATLRAQAVAGAEDTARLVKENTRLREPDTYWLADDPETGNNDVEDFRYVIEVGEVARLIVGHTLPPQWAAHVRIPETPTSDADSEVQLFATAAEAHAALATPERAP